MSMNEILHRRGVLSRLWRGWLHSWSILRRQHVYLAVSGSLFLCGALYGYFDNGALHSMLMGGMAQLQEKAKAILGNPSPLYEMQAIFLNNLKSAVMAILLGVFIGVVPIFIVFANGALVGFLLLLLHSHAAMNPFVLLLAGVLPHGIFEIPAFLFAASAGIKIGWSLLIPAKNATRWQSFAGAWREAIRLLVIIVPLLAAAAVIEISITPHLLHAFVPQRGAGAA